MPIWFDYREEIGRLINDSPGTVGQGYWLVLRMSRLGQYSENWDEDRQEVKDGSKYEYDDLLVRTISTISGGLSLRSAIMQSYAQILSAGHEDMATHIFAIDMASLDEHTAWRTTHSRRLPTQVDTIFEIAECEGPSRPAPPLTAVSRFAIVGSEPVRGDNGKVEFMLVLARRDHSK